MSPATTPTLKLRSRPEGVGIARAFVVASARVLGAAPNEIDGLRLAVSELATLLVMQGEGSFEIGVTDRDGLVAVELSPEGPPPPVPAEIEAIVRRGLAGNADLGGDRWILTVGDRL